jgi:hypothetical protein
MNAIGQIFAKGGGLYRELLKSDEWKAFSRDIRQNHGGCCAICKRRDVITHVHHFYYDPNRLPWQYNSDEVVLLCETCHREMHKELQQFRKFVFGKLTPRTLQILNGALAVGLDNNDPLLLAHAIAEMCASPASVQRFAHAWEK